MSLVAKVEQLLREEADGALKALKAVAEHVESLAPGAAGADPSSFAVDVPAIAEALVGKFKSEFDAAIAAFLEAAKGQVDGKLAALESEVSAALAKLHGASAQPAVAGGAGDPNVEQQPANVEQPQG